MRSTSVEESIMSYDDEVMDGAGYLVILAGAAVFLIIGIILAGLIIIAEKIL
jgi:hypothetical protein